MQKQRSDDFYRTNMNRCSWAEGSDLMVEYHDSDWGAPNHRDRDLFEFLILEGAQAGLSWSTILNKRDGYRVAYDRFDPEKVAAYGPKKIEQLIENPEIVRNKLKIEASVRNAKAFLEVQEEFGSFDTYIWKFVGGAPIQNSRDRLEDIPATTAKSDAMSMDLKERGFKFVGSTICYAFMQATGMVNDHLVDCFRYEEVQRRG